MATKSRDPKALSHDDLVTWSFDLVDWLEDRAGDLDLSPRAGDFPALATAYEDAYHAEIAPQQYSPLLNKEVKELAEPLVEVLQLVRRRIPMLPGIPESALADFGLGDEISRDWDKLKAVAAVCMAHWMDISGGGVPPEYLPVSADMANMVSSATAFIAKHTAYRASIGDKQDAVAYKNACRDALLECEREIFQWYRAAHWDGKDPWWRTTPWGSTGQSGEPEPPAPGELPQLPTAPEGLNVVIWWEPSLMLLISVGPYGEHTGFDLCKAETPMGMMEPPDRPDENLVSNLPLDVEPFGDGEVVPGMKYWYWARARNGGDVGDWTEPFGIDVE